MHGIGAEPKLIPEIDFAAGCFRLPRNRRELLALPYLDRCRITLIGTLQRFLRRQPQLGQQLPHRRHTKSNAKLSLDQLSHQAPRPQPEIQTMLTRITTVDPTKDLLLLAQCQTAWSPRRRPRTEPLSPTPGFDAAFSHR